MGKNYTLYINIDNFAKEANKSGLVNRLLGSHYAGQVFEPEPFLVPPVAKNIPRESDGKLCKHGADPNFCKFRKNGKPCK